MFLIALVTAINYRGLAVGAAFQKLFTAVKIAGLLMLIASRVL